MKVLIVSDIHGNFECMKKVIENDSSFDKLLILGDILYGPNLSGYNPEQLAMFLNLFKDKIIAVRGNCDSTVDILNFPVGATYLLIPIDGKNILMTHGNYYFPSIADSYNTTKVSDRFFSLTLLIKSSIKGPSPTIYIL